MEYLRGSSTFGEESKSKRSVTEWMRENKLSVVGGVWTSSIAASLAFNTFCSRPYLKPSLRLIHARIHAQAITLAALASAAAFNVMVDRSAKSPPPNSKAFMLPQSQPHIMDDVLFFALELSP